MFDLFSQDDKKKFIEKTRQLLEKGKGGILKAWEGHREELARREREKAYEEDYEAEFRYRDQDLDFRMLITSEEAHVYEQAKKKLKEVKSLDYEPHVYKQWESKKYLSLHDYFTKQIRYYFERRNEDPVALHRTIRYCERQIEYAPVAAKAYWMDPYTYALPKHPGYDTLIFLYQEVEEWDGAIRLAKKAKKQGWDGDWESKIQELEDHLRSI